MFNMHCLSAWMSIHLHTLAHIYHRGHLRILNYDYQTCRNLSYNIKIHR